MPLDGDHFWTRISPQSTRSRPEESRAAHEGVGAPTPLGRAPRPRGQPRDPPDVKSMQNSSIYTQTSRKKPRSEVPPPQASVATKNQSGPSSGTLPEGGTLTGGHLHHPGALHDEEGVVHPRG